MNDSSGAKAGSPMASKPGIQGDGAVSQSPPAASGNAGGLDLLDHPAVILHGEHVMTSGTLASFTECLASLASARLMGTGQDQYSFTEGGQLFEDNTQVDLIQDYLEEAADAINYIAMGAIKALSAHRKAQEVSRAAGQES